MRCDGLSKRRIVCDTTCFLYSRSFLLESPIIHIELYMSGRQTVFNIVTIILAVVFLEVGRNVSNKIRLLLLVLKKIGFVTIIVLIVGWNGHDATLFFMSSDPGTMNPHQAASSSSAY